MKRILLTGASGFIGRACVRPLLARGYEIHCISRVPANVPRGVTAHRGDLLDRQSMRGLVATIAPSHLLHSAWDVSHRGYWTSPSNLVWLSASIDLLEAFVAGGGRRAVGVGTCAEYELECASPPGVSTRITPLTPYGATKLALFNAFVAVKGMGLDSAWARIFYPYGPGEGAGRLLSAAVNALLDGRDFDCSDGTQVRDFIHVDDVGAALGQLVDTDVTGAVDVGTGRRTPVRGVLEEVIRQLGHGERIHFGALPIRATEPPTLVADTRRLIGEVCFTPAVDVPNGIADLVAYIRATRESKSGDAAPLDLQGCSTLSTDAPLG
jgi:nucleoside-diphosphate-sugar epimerase